MSYFRQVTTTPRDLGSPDLPRQAAARARQAVGWNHDFYPKSGMGAYADTPMKALTLLTAGMAIGMLLAAHVVVR